MQPFAPPFTRRLSSSPNNSFESPSTLPVGVSTSIDSWQKIPKPAYFDEAAFGFQWIQTAGIFYDTNPYVTVMESNARTCSHFRR